MKLKYSLQEGYCPFGTLKISKFKLTVRSKTLRMVLLLPLLPMFLFGYNNSISKMNANAPLNPGQQMPDIPLGTIHKNPGIAKLSDLKGKLIILDFWATWCSSCLVNFPKMERLQKQFGDNIQILPVTYQNGKTLDDFYSTENGKRYDVTTVYGDSELKTLFPHQGMPYCVWIDQKGVVLAFTSAAEVAAENITKALHGDVSKLIPTIERDPDQPLFLSPDQQVSDTLQFYSILSKGEFIGFGNGNHKRVYKDKVIGEAITNSNLLWIYETAALGLFDRSKENFSDSRMIIKVRDTAKITLNPDRREGSYTVYKTDNLYNYDLIVPLKDTANLYNYMMEDLNRYTDYIGKVEKEQVSCLILKRTDNVDRLKSKGGSLHNSLFSSPPYILRNLPVKSLILRLGEMAFPDTPVLDETGYRGHIDLSLPKVATLEGINAGLQQYGLILTRESRNINMFTLSDKPHQTQ